MQERQRTNVDGTACAGLGEIEPTPVGAGAEALESQLPLCVEDFLASDLPVIGEAAYPTGETYPCIEFEGIIEWGQVTTRQQVESERDLGDRIVAWTDVVIDELGVAPSLDWGPYAVDLQSATAAGDGVLPAEAYGHDLLLAAMELASNSSWKTCWIPESSRCRSMTTTRLRISGQVWTVKALRRSAPKR